MLSTQTTLDASTQPQACRPTSKIIICPACGYANILQRRLYYWLLSKEKNARCHHCGRPLPLQ